MSYNQCNLRTYFYIHYSIMKDMALILTPWNHVLSNFQCTYNKNECFGTMSCFCNRAMDIYLDSLKPRATITESHKFRMFSGLPQRLNCFVVIITISVLLLTGIRSESWTLPLLQWSRSWGTLSLRHNSRHCWISRLLRDCWHIVQSWSC